MKQNKTTSKQHKIHIQTHNNKQRTQAITQMHQTHAKQTQIQTIIKSKQHATKLTKHQNSQCNFGI